MEKGRWYPSNLTLETGEVAILAGLYQTGTNPEPTLPPPVDPQMNPEIYTPATNSLEVMAPNVGLGLPTYPFVFLDPLTRNDEAAPRGVFVAGPRRSYFWNPRGGREWQRLMVARSKLIGKFQDGSAVMYDSEQGSVLMVGGRATGNSDIAITSAKTITLNQANPHWEDDPGMAHPRSCIAPPCSLTARCW